MAVFLGYCAPEHPDNQADILARNKGFSYPAD